VQKGCKRAMKRHSKLPPSFFSMAAIITSHTQGTGQQPAVFSVPGRFGKHTLTPLTCNM
jgi:hypothetical protein